MKKTIIALTGIILGLKVTIYALRKKKSIIQPNCKFYTTLPEDYTGKDFNGWAKHIYKIRK